MEISYIRKAKPTKLKSFSMILPLRGDIDGTCVEIYRELGYRHAMISNHGILRKILAEIEITSVTWISNDAYCISNEQYIPNYHVSASTEWTPEDMAIIAYRIAKRVRQEYPYEYTIPFRVTYVHSK